MPPIAAEQELALLEHMHFNTRIFSSVTTSTSVLEVQAVNKRSPYFIQVDQPHEPHHLGQ